MKKLIVFILALGILFTSRAYAGTTCTPIYGGGETCVTTGKIELNKQVLKPGTSDTYVDNLSRDKDPRYAPNQNVVFKLSVTNTGEQTLNEVTVTDTFPQYVKFVAGNGDFNTTTKVLTFKVFNLNPNETRTFFLNAVTEISNNLPNDSGITCIVNHAKAVSSENTAEDTSTLCIEKGLPQPVTKGGQPVQPVPQVTTTPSTGPEMFALFGLIPAGLSGFLLRRKTAVK